VGQIIATVADHGLIDPWRGYRICSARPATRGSSRFSREAVAMDDALPTPRSMARTSFRLLVWCKSCRHQANADLAALVARVTCR